MVGQAGVREGVLGALLNGSRLLACRLQLQSLLASSQRARVQGRRAFGDTLKGARLLGCQLQLQNLASASFWYRPGERWVQKGWEMVA